MTTLHIHATLTARSPFFLSSLIFCQMTARLPRLPVMALGSVVTLLAHLSVTAETGLDWRPLEGL